MSPGPQMFAIHVPAALVNDEPALRAYITSCADAAGFDVEPDAEIEVTTHKENTEFFPGNVIGRAEVAVRRREETP